VNRNWRGLRTANGLWKAPNGHIEVLNWRICEDFGGAKKWIKGAS